MNPRLSVVPTAPVLRCPRVAGVDGCRGGWVVATAVATRPATPPATAVAAEVLFEVIDVEVVATFDEIVRRVRDGELDAVAVDMPIGLAAGARRSCDVAARAELGPRRSSVFPAPIRAVLDSTDFAAANATSRRLSDRGLPIQTWNLIPKIREVDDALTPELQNCVREAHPELAVARLLRHPAAHPKRSAEGRSERLATLGESADWARRPAPRGAAPDDVIDALALATTARRMLTGEVVVLGDGAVDERGLRLEILY